MTCEGNSQNCLTCVPNFTKRTVLISGFDYDICEGDLEELIETIEAVMN